MLSVEVSIEQETECEFGLLLSQSMMLAETPRGDKVAVATMTTPGLNDVAGVCMSERGRCTLSGVVPSVAGADLQTTASTSEPIHLRPGHLHCATSNTFVRPVEGWASPVAPVRAQTFRYHNQLNDATPAWAEASEMRYKQTLVGAATSQTVGSSAPNLSANGFALSNLTTSHLGHCDNADKETSGARGENEGDCERVLKDFR